MKIGGMEGTPEEIHNLFRNNGMDINRFLSPPMRRRWVIVPSVFCVVCVVLMVAGPLMFSEFSLKCLNATILILLIGVLWLSAVVQVAYDKWVATLVVVVGGVIVALVAGGLMLPAEIIPTIRTLK